MKIAFWSTWRGRNGVTSNLACMSVLSQFIQPKRTILFENHRNINNLGDILISKKSQNILKEQKAYKADSGIEYLLKLLKKQEWIDEEQIGRSCVPLLSENLCYLPGDKRINQEIMEYELAVHLKSLLNMAETFYEMIYVDTAGNPKVSTQKILKEADVIVVNLTQNPYVLSHYFRNFKEMQKKAFYLISHYEQNSMFSKKMIEKEFDIPSGRLGVIPHHISFSDAMSEGRLISFIKSNCSCGRKNYHYDFFTRAKEAATLLNHYACESACEDVCKDVCESVCQDICEDACEAAL